MRSHVVLGIAGAVGGLLWIAFLAPLQVWGPPGSANYDIYEASNRFLALALALAGCGFLGLYRRYRLPGRVHLGAAATLVGIAVMVGGSLAEFVVFTDRSYTDPARSWGWGAFLIGLLIALAGIFLTGLDARRRADIPRWAALVFTLALPATVLALLLAAALYGVPLIIASLTAGILAARSGPPKRTAALST